MLTGGPDPVFPIARFQGANQAVPWPAFLESESDPDIRSIWRPSDYSAKAGVLSVHRLINRRSTPLEISEEMSRSWTGILQFERPRHLTGHPLLSDFR
jgi:hypothetical protein